MKMASWSIISTGFNNFDESINFGTRAVTISDEVIYESTTYATIQTDDQDILNESPVCNALFSPIVGVIVASDKSLTLFEYNCSTVVFTVHFEHSIEYIELSQAGDIIFCGFCNGTFTCLKVQNEGKILFTKSLVDETSNISDSCFTRIVSKCLDNCFEVYIFVKNGTVFRAYHNDMKQLIECANNEEPGNISEMITFSTIISQSSLNVVVSPIFNYDDEDCFIFGNKSGSKLCSLGRTHSSTFVDDSFSIKQIEYVPASKHLICLSEEGYLHIVCGFSFQVIMRWSGGKVKTFMLLEDPGNQMIENKTHSFMIIITDSDHPEIFLVELPVLKVMFKIRVAQHTYLVKKQNDLEDILYIEGFGENSNIDTLRIKSIAQSSPHFRLNRLLQRYKFTEAEQLTQKFNLNVEEVYKVKAKWLMDKFSFNKEPESALHHFNELLSILEKIEAVEFVSECCLKVIAPDLKMTQQLYNYALERLQRIKTHKTNDLIKLMDELTETKITLGTYIKVYECTSCSQDWLIFSRSNPIMTCRNFLLEGKIQKAVIVCNRHRERIQKDLPTEVAVELFEKIPATFQVEEVLKWLQSYLPVLMESHPDLESNFISWVICRTKSLELERKENWLEYALNFVHKVIEILNDLCPFLFLDFDHPLQIFTLQIQQLIVLKTDYSISIDFEEFYKCLQNDQTELIMLILSKVGEHKLSCFILGEFFNKFCIKNKLEKSNILFTYVTKMVKQSSIFWDIERAWESRALSIISFLQNKQYKMKAIESTIGSFSIPWNSQVTALVDEAIKMDDDPLALKIYHHMKKVPIRLMMKKHGLPESVSCDSSRLIQYILLKCQGSIIDAKEVVKFGDENEKLLPYTLHLIYTVFLGKIEMGLQFTKDELNKDGIIEVIQQAMSQLIILIQNRNIKSEEECFNAIPRLYSTLLTLEPNAAGKLKKDIFYVNSIRQLKNKYKIYLSMNKLYAPKNKKEQLLRKYISEICYFNEIMPDKMIKDVGELANLLNFPRKFGLLELGFFYLPKANQSQHMHFLRLLLDSDNFFFKSYSTRILDLVGILIQIVTKGLKSGKDFWEITLNVISKVLLHGNKSILRYGMELLNVAKLYKPEVNTTFSKGSVWSSNIGQVETSPVLPSTYYQLYSKVHPRLKEVLEESTSFSTCNEVIENIPDDSSAKNKDLSELCKAVEESLKIMPNNLQSIHRIQSIFWNLSSKGESLGDDNMIKILSRKVFNVLPRIVFSQNLEMKLAICLLKLVPNESALSWIQNYIRARKENWDQLNNASSVALAGIHYAIITNHWNNMSKQVIYNFTVDYLKFQCFRKLQHFGIAPSVANTYCETYDGKRDLLLKVITLQDVDVNFLGDICKDLNFNFQECLLLYLKQTLLNWEVSYDESINPETGKNEFVLLSNTSDLMLKCSKIEAMIMMKDEVVKYLEEDILAKVNFYYYEVFIVIFEILLKLAPSHLDLYYQHRELLSFLFSYRRISNLSSEETDGWFHVFPDMPSVPRISKYRLPFLRQLPSNIWNIIRPELSLGTYKLWLNVPMWLNVNIDKDIICSYTIMNLKRDVSGVSDWNLHLEHRPLMDDITECISMIQSIETTVAALYCVINYVLPPGADRVDAAQKCLLKAKEWVSVEHSKNAIIGLEKAEKKYFAVSTYHNLYKYQLAKPEYLALSHQPVILITALYHDPSIVNKEKQLSTNLPDINEAVTKIANLHGIELSSHFIQFLSDWIQPPDSLNSSYEAVNISLTLSVYTLTDNIIRACYILRGFKYMPALKNFVISIAFSQDKSAGTRLKALQCLCASCSIEELEGLTARNQASIEELMKSLELVSELVKLSLIYTLSDFESCNKEDLVELLLNSPTPESILVATKIALTNQLWTPSIWNSLLSSMTSHSMVNILKHTLPKVKFLVNKIESDIVKEAWECLIFTTLSQLRNRSENERETEDEEMEESLLLIESCPITIDLHKVIAIYNELNYPQAAKMISKFV